MDLTLLQTRLGHTFRDAALLQQALTHRSHSSLHNERFEFLGDSVLDLVVSELLMERFPDVDEGALSKWRASLVNEATLGEIARELDLGAHLHLGRSEHQRRAEMRARLLASAYEALLAAIYLDAGLAAVTAVVRRHFEARLNTLKVDEGFKADFKTRLQEWAQSKHKVTPEYRLLGTDGPEHEKQFQYEVLVGAQVLGTGRGQSRKGAEQSAALAALTTLEGEAK